MSLRQICLLAATLAAVAAILLAATLLPSGTFRAGFVSVSVVDGVAPSDLAEWMARGLFGAIVVTMIVAAVVLLIGKRNP
jgi:hypothetical protein